MPLVLVLKRTFAKFLLVISVSYGHVILVYPSFSGHCGPLDYVLCSIMILRIWLRDCPIPKIQLLVFKKTYQGDSGKSSELAD